MSGSESGLPKIVDVVDNDLCIACGACVHACPYGSVVPAYDSGRGAQEVRVVNFDQCRGCDAPCERVCPSIEVNIAELLTPVAPVGTAAAVDRKGPVEAVYTAYASAHRDNGVSSSGGIVRALVVDALRRGVGVICLAQSSDGYAATLLAGLDGSPNLPGSIYHSVSFCDAIPLIRSAEAACMIVATPCQLEGIKKFIRECDPGLDDKIEFCVGLICGWMYSDHSIAAFLSYKGISGDVVDVGYRGEDEVGKLKIRTIDTERDTERDTEHDTERDTEHQFDRRRFVGLGDRLDYATSFSRSMNRLRCRLCEDHVNVLADIAVGDAWLSRHQGEKLSIVAIRSAAAAKRFAEVVAREDIVVGTATPADLIESQSADLVYGQAARKLRRWLEGRGMATPRFDFAEHEQPLERLSALDKLAFSYEAMMRRLAREGRYRVVRLLYLARMMVTMARDAARARSRQT